MRDAEQQRLNDDDAEAGRWKRWGPYLAERQWGTVREDYSADGAAWDYFPHDHARSRAYRWGEDGLLGISDDHGRLCFALALWNGRDAILKERLFGLTGPEGNHGEDVKECYYFLDATPTASYLKALYKYPQREFPYNALVQENRRRDRRAPEFELADTGVFDDDRYFDVTVEYAKGDPEDLFIQITVQNRGPDAALVHLLPTLWFRNVWSWGREGEHFGSRPVMRAANARRVEIDGAASGRLVLVAHDASDGSAPSLLFTENDTNTSRLFGVPNEAPFVKDAFHRHVVDGEEDAVNSARQGSKTAAHYTLNVPASASTVVQLRLAPADTAPDASPSSEAFARTIATLSLAEADTILRQSHKPSTLSVDETRRSAPSDTPDCSGPSNTTTTLLTNGRMATRRSPHHPRPDETDAMRIGAT